MADTTTPAPAAVLDQLSFRHPWRTYQRLMLARAAELCPPGGAGQAKLHLVAPPGSGKTLVGLELIRRFGAPAVVLAPTTTIQQQWADKVGMFTTPEVARGVVSTDPHRLATVNVFTYQLLAVVDRAGDTLKAAAQARWVDDLVVGDQAATEGEAARRLEEMAVNHPANYRREMRRRTVRARRELLAAGSDVLRFLHPNARALIDRLVAHGVRTVVLDECHHLLDHWALVVRALLDRIGGTVNVVGLTATLPDPDDRRSYDNYTALLGDVDFEVPTPAVVKEGDLAPYRDLVYFVEPTPAEARVLGDATGALTAVLGEVLSPTRVTTWAGAVLFGPDAARRADHLVAQLRERPALATAAARWVAAAGAWPAGVPRPVEAGDEVGFDDHLTLVERYALDVLAVSADRGDHDLLRRLRRALGGFGLTLTERGLRHGRSVGDLVLAFSAAKDTAVVDILRREHADLGDRLRAVVVTDFARMSSAAAKAGAALRRDAGSAHRVFHALLADEGTNRLEPMLVTGRTVLVDADHGEQLVARLNRQLRDDRLDATCRAVPTADPLALEIVGEGPQWSSRTYVRLLTEALEAGITHCLVGTRGIFGEGWDALSLNTLVDLTSVTTSTGVQQLRGRSFRLDPDWEEKVAHNWDVVCVAPDHPRGDTDLRRFVRRHGRLWGVVPPTGWEEWLAKAAAAIDLATVGADVADMPQLAGSPTGYVARGVVHVSPQLAADLAFRPFKRVPFHRHTRRSLAAVGHRPDSYGLWGVGAPYDNFETRAATVDPADLRVRTVHTVTDTLKALAARTAAVLAGAGLIAGWYFARGLLGGAGAVAAGALAAATAATLIALNARTIAALVRKLFVEQPPDAILLDVGRAVLEGLQGAGQVSPHLQPEYVRVHARPDHAYEVLVDYASPDDAATFIDAYRQTLGPIGDPRYLVLRTDARLPSLGLTAVWLPLRTFVRSRVGRPSYHPVPDVLATNRSRAEAFAAAWAAHVGGGSLVYTRSDEGRRILLAARSQPRRSARSYAFERWR